MYNQLVHGVSNRYEKLEKLFQAQNPRVFVEVGVWRGERAVQFIESALQRHQPSEIYYFGFDLFEEMTQEMVSKEVSRPLPNPTLADVEARLAKFVSMGVHVKIVPGNTLETLLTANTPRIEFAFIDGGHSYETVKSDWHNISQRLEEHGVIVIDDFVNRGAIAREGFGINQLIDEIDRNIYDVKIQNPEDWWPRPWGIFRNRLVRISRRRSRT